MTHSRRLLSLALLAAGLCQAAAVHATIIFTTNPATFAALSSAPQTDDYSDLLGSFLAGNTRRLTDSPNARTAPYAYTVYANNDIYVIHNAGNAVPVLSTFSHTGLSFDGFLANPHDGFTNESIRGFSGNVTLLDRQNNVVPGRMDVFARNYRGEEVRFALDLTGSSFLGVYSDHPLSNVYFSTGLGSTYVGLSGPVLAVPEPSGWLLAGAGLGLIALWARRQQGSTAAQPCSTAERIGN